jgi:hypothetical protein
MSKKYGKMVHIYANKYSITLEQSAIVMKYALKEARVWYLIIKQENTDVS